MLAGEGDGHAGFPAGVSQLNAGAGALGVNELSDPREGGDVVVFPDAEVAERDAAFRGDRGGFKGDESGAALGASTEMNEMPVCGEAVL